MKKICITVIAILFVTMSSIFTLAADLSNFEKGVLSYRGKGNFEKDYNKSFKFFEKAAYDGKQSDAKILIAYMYLNGDGVKKNRDKYKELMQSVATDGSLEAEYLLLNGLNGKLISLSFGNREEYKKVLNRYVAGISDLAKKGHDRSVVIHSLMYINGDIEDNNISKALKSIEKLAKTNSDFYFLTKGVLLIQNGKKQEGFSALDQALSVTKNNLVVQYISNIKTIITDKKFASQTGSFGYSLTDSLQDFVTSKPFRLSSVVSQLYN